MVRRSVLLKVLPPSVGAGLPLPRFRGGRKPSVLHPGPPTLASLMSPAVLVPSVVREVLVSEAANFRSFWRQMSREGPAMEYPTASSHSVRHVVSGHRSSSKGGEEPQPARSRHRNHAGWSLGSSAARQPFRGQTPARVSAASLQRVAGYRPAKVVFHTVCSFPSTSTLARPHSCSCPKRQVQSRCTTESSGTVLARRCFFWNAVPYAQAS